MARPAVDIETLSVEERLSLIDALWESLSSESIGVTEAQRRELDRRLDRLERDGPTDVSMDDFLARLEARAP